MREAVEKVGVGPVDGPELGSKRPEWAFLMSNGEPESGTKEFFNTLAPSRHSVNSVAGVSGRTSVGRKGCDGIDKGSD